MTDSFPQDVGYDAHAVGLQHVLNDPVGFFYIPVLLSLICMYFTQD